MKIWHIAIYDFLYLHCLIRTFVAIASSIEITERLHRPQSRCQFISEEYREVRTIPIAECNNVTRNCRHQRKYNDDDEDICHRWCVLFHHARTLIPNNRLYVHARVFRGCRRWRGHRCPRPALQSRPTAV